MCGRYELHTHPAAIALAFGLPAPPLMVPRYNIAPMQPVPVVRLSADGARECVDMRWGLVPLWAKDLKMGFFNMPQIPGGAGNPNSVLGVSTGFVVNAKSQHQSDALLPQTKRHPEQRQHLWRSAPDDQSHADLPPDRAR